MVSRTGFEPVTHSLKGKCSSFGLARPPKESQTVFKTSTFLETQFHYLVYLLNSLSLIFENVLDFI